MAFDPYYKWLGITPNEQPANHYRLLGLALFEADPEVISNVALQRMAHVRSFAIGQHMAESQKLLNEIAVAKITLIDPQKKSRYDEALRKSQPAKEIPPPPVIEPPHDEVLKKSEPAKEIPPPPVIEPPHDEVLKKSEQAKTIPPRPVIKKKKRKRKYGEYTAIAACMATCLVILGAVCFLIYNVVSSGVPKYVAVSAQSVPQPELVSQPSPKPKTVQPGPSVRKPTPPVAEKSRTVPGTGPQPPRPVASPVVPSGLPSLDRQDSRSRWLSETYGTAIYHVVGNEWAEMDNKTGEKKWSLTETNRTGDYVEVHLELRSQTMRIFDDRMELCGDGETKWSWVANGGWLQQPSGSSGAAPFSPHERDKPVNNFKSPSIVGVEPGGGLGRGNGPGSVRPPTRAYQPLPTTAVKLPSGFALNDAVLEIPHDWLDRFFPSMDNVYANKYPNGKIQAIFHFGQQGKLDGHAATLYETGELQTLGSYTANSLDGPLRVWEKNKQRLLYAEYKRGKKQGVSCLFRDGLPWFVQDCDKDQVKSRYLVKFTGVTPVVRPDKGLSDPEKKELESAEQKLAELEEQMAEDQKTVRKS